MISLKTRISRLLLLAAWAAGMSMSSCSSDPEVEAADSVEVRNLQDEICFAYDSEEPLAFSIVSNKTWSIAKSNLDWLEVSQMNGGSKYPSTVLLTPSVNDDLERSGILTVYAGATTRRVTIVQEAFPIVPEITLCSGLPDDKTLRFSYTDAAPVTFSIYSNIAWQASTSGLDGWAEVAPLEGARKQETEIVVTPTPNEGDERSGTITFTGEGLEEPLVVNVSQEAVDPTPLLIVSGIKDGQVAFANAPEAPFTFSVQCNRRWEITGENLDWLTVEPSSGRSSLIPVEVALTARDNELYEPLEGRLTLHVYDDAIEDVTITVTQDANKRLLAQWTMDDTVPWKTYNPNFAADGRMKADLPEGTGSRRGLAAGQRDGRRQQLYGLLQDQQRRNGVQLQQDLERRPPADLRARREHGCRRTDQHPLLRGHERLEDAPFLGRRMVCRRRRVDTHQHLVVPVAGHERPELEEHVLRRDLCDAQ